MCTVLGIGKLYDAVFRIVVIIYLRTVRVTDGSRVTYIVVAVFDITVIVVVN